MGLKTNKYKKLIIITLKIAGNINDQIENPDALRTVSSLFLFSFIYVCAWSLIKKQLEESKEIMLEYEK